ncbi:hypothetical protein [Helicobacter anatolicus]|uniref:hypothetical protein n=1 Tax=Helicobacter anatolicus TaxID=2905874 RepID=UPI001E63A391|nr:hypothetical protein [Helicobacter anatolicus]MCE3040090.1 hypothetical protein [Helicobacter anatolicus]
MSETINDIFEQKLHNTLQNLQECQKNKNFTSCMQCEKILQCQIRQEYVKSVYESMNKGEQGAFEF